MFLPRFSGDANPEHWIFRAELYFTYLGFDEKDWLPLPSFYLDGAALTWFTWLFRNKQFYDWKHFKEKFAQRFPLAPSRDRVGRLAHSSEACFTYVNSVPIVSQSTMVSPFAALGHFPTSSASASAYNTGSSQADHVFDKSTVKYKYVESVALLTKNNTEVEHLEDIETSQVGNANSVEANLVHEPSSITADQVFDEISHAAVSSNIPTDQVLDEISHTTGSSNIHDLKAIVHEVEHSVTTVAKVYHDSFDKETKVPLAVLHDTDGSNNDEEENSHNNVAWFEKSSPLNTSGLLVAFAFQGTVISNAGLRLAAIKYPFADSLWLRTIPYWYNSLEEFRGGNQNGVLLCLDFRLRKCNWVDTGQECTLPGFLLFGIGAHKNSGSLAFSLRSVIFLVRMTGSGPVSFRALLHSTPPATSDEEDSGALISKRITISCQEETIVEALCLDNFFSENVVSIPTSKMPYVEVCLEADNGKYVERFNGQHILSQFPFVPAANFLTVTIPVTALDPCVWDPGIGFDFMDLTSCTVNSVDELVLLGCTGKFFLITYSNSMSRVWDPGQPWCVNSYLSNECSIVYNYISFTGPSIAYTLVVDEYYYAVKHEVLEANFKHTTILHHHYIIALAATLLEWKAMVLRSGYKVKLQAELPSAGYTLYGVIEMVEWAARHRLHRGLGTALVFVIFLNKCVLAGQDITELHLIMPKNFTVNQKECGCNWLISTPMEIFGGRRASNTIHRYFKVNITIGSDGIDAKDEWSEKGIATSVRNICQLVLENMTKVPYVAASSASVILELNKNYATMSMLLQSANQIMILFLGVLAYCSRVYNTPSCQMTFFDLNLEDKVLFGGGCIVVNQVKSIRAYRLEVVNETGPSKMLECFIWDPGPINIWLKGRTDFREELCILLRKMSSPLILFLRL